MSVCPIKCLEIPIDVIASHAPTRIYKYETEQINTILKPFYNTNKYALSYIHSVTPIGYYYPINKESNPTKPRFIAKPKL
jgi:hypothetical protein